MSEVIIPPVPSQEKQKSLEEGFLKAEELPAFEEHEFISARQEASGEKTTAEKVRYEQLPYEVVHKVIRATCIIAMLVWFVLIILLGLELGTANTFIGLLPILLTIIITYILVDKYHLENGFLMAFPFIFTGIFFILGQAHYLPEGMDYGPLSSINIIFGLVFDIVIIVHYNILRRQRKIKVKEEKREEKKIEQKEEKKEEKKK